MIAFFLGAGIAIAGGTFLKKAGAAGTAGALTPRAVFVERRSNDP